MLLSYVIPYEQRVPNVWAGQFFFGLTKTREKISASAENRMNLQRFIQYTDSCNVSIP